jgi:multidrug efflux pump subunit AcrB
VTVGVLTTVLAFAPLYYTEGFFGDILWVVPVVVISVLLMSLLEAILILPAHLSGGRSAAARERKRGTIALVQARLRGVLDGFVQRCYLPALRASLRLRYVTIAGAVVCLVLTVGLVRGGFVRFTLFPEIDADDISARVSMVGGTPAAETRRVLDRMVAAAEAVRAELDPEQPPGSPSLYRNLAATLGSQPFGGGGGPGGGAGASGSNVAEVAIELTPGEERTIGADRIVARWKELVGELPGATELDFTSTLLSAGDDISVELAHADPDRLLEASEALKRYLADFDGLSELSDSFEPGKRELNFALTEAGLASGLTLNDLARQVRQAFYGFEAQRIQRGRDEIKVLVRYTEAERRSLATIDDMRVRLPDGSEVPLGTVARLTEGRGYATIDRTDRRRVVRVSADVDERAASAGDINRALKDDFLPALNRDIPGLAYSFEGAERERAESLRSLGAALGIAMLGIFALIAAQLKSYTQPLVIMSVVPIGVVGAVLGHLALGYDLSFFSSFGVVALSGVVVNDSLVLMDMINRLRRDGMPALEAAVAAGARRFRPILFTTLTTCAGLLPMITERSLQAQFLIPMAISLAAGVAFATVITLLAVPALYLIREDLIGLGQRAGRAVRVAAEPGVHP